MEQLLQKIQNKKATVGIVGLGYVGLPLAVEFAKAGFQVLGFEVDARKANKLNEGVSYIPDIPTEILAKEVHAHRLSATTDFSRIAECDTISVCVPTPLSKNKDPDLTYIISATEQIQKYLRKGQLIVLESTTFPGTTSEIVAPMLEKTGLQIGQDFLLAFSPERIDPGNQHFGVKNTPKIVGGTTAVCTQASAELYGAIIDRVIQVSSPTSAEMVKLLENTFRAVNIGLVNELAIIAEKLKLDVWEIIDAAASKPFGFMPFYPGPGLGGHCIPIDPHYLSWKLRTLNYRTRFIEIADDINSHMPDYVVDKVAYALNEDSKPLKRSKILVLGVAYKRDIDDWRESPAIAVLAGLKQRGADVCYYDPFVPELPLAHHGEGEDWTSIAFSYADLKNYDCVVIVTDHSQFDAQAIYDHSIRIVDTRNLLGKRGVRGDKVIKL
jgi:UDP-N-acetyl-D-glucosamine dehydrogenase